MWSIVGIVLCAALAVAAWWRSRAPGGAFDDDVYGMTRSTHRRYAMVALALLILCALSFAIPALPVAAVLTVTIVVCIFYGSSFLRGAESDE